MRNTWKKVLAAACTALMLMTMPGFSVLADEMQEEEYFVTDAKIPEESERFVGAADEYMAHSVEEIIEEDIVIQEAAEEIVGEGEIQVGDGVTATFDEDTGAVEFYSDGGTLWADWVYKSGISWWRIESIRVTSGKVFLPDDSSTMFSGCDSLTSLDLRGFDTSRVTNMSSMFSGCDSLTSLDLRGFDTSRVTNMSWMFSDCYRLTSLDLSSFDMSNVTDDEDMLSSSSALQTLITPKINSNKILLPIVMCDVSENLYNMLPTGSQSVYLTKKDGFISVGDNVFATVDEETGSVEFISNNGVLWADWTSELHISAREIKSIKVKSGTVYLPAVCCFDWEDWSLDGGEWYSKHGIFGDLGITSFDSSGFDTSNVSSMSNMFGMCENLTYVDLSHFDFTNVTSADGFFDECSNLETLVLDLASFGESKKQYIEIIANYNFDADYDEYLHIPKKIKMNNSDPNVADVSSLFAGLYYLESLDLSGFDTSNVTDMGYMFYNCWNLKELDLSSFDTSAVTSMEGMFSNCRNLKSLDLRNFDTSNVTIMNGYDEYWANDDAGMFAYCESLTSLDLSSFNTEKITEMSYMFNGCRSLKSLNLSSFDTSKVKSMVRMFDSCRDLINLDLSGFNTSSVINMAGMFQNCTSLTSLNLNSFDTSNVVYMGMGPRDDGTFGMFEYCTSLTSLDLSNFDTSNVKAMEFMFRSCTSLTSLNLSSFDTSDVWDMSFMFNGCSSLTSLNLSNFDTSKVTCMARMFTDCSSLTSLDLSSFDMSNIENYSDSYYFDHEAMLEGCSALLNLETPKKNEQSVDLPYNMYDESGVEYEKLPNLSESITLTKEKPEIKTDLNDCAITLSATSYTYDGTAKKPLIIAKNGSTILTVGTDYTVSYVDNTDAGTATAKITGTGDYKGEKDITFTINKADTKLSFAESEVTKKTTDPAFTITLTKTTDGTVTFKSSNTNVAIVNSTSGLITIKGAGTATITATAAEGKNYKKGSTAFTLTVKAPAPTPTPKPTSTPVPKPTTEGFSDVQDPNHAYYKAIYWAADAGITKGYSDGTFGINKNCTRGEMMMFLWRYAGKPAPKNVSKSPFKDVPKTHTFYKAILWGSQKGITKGYADGTFGINRNVSRGECMMFLWRLRGKPAPKAVAKAPFPDVPKSHVFYNAVLWGYQKKITTGFTSGKLKGKFGVNENCSRGQIVTFLYRAK